MKKVIKKSSLPHSNLKELLGHVKKAGELDEVNWQDIAGDFQFLRDLGVFKVGESVTLTESGSALFKAAFIRQSGEEIAVIRGLLLDYPPTIAIQQYLWGVKDIKVDQIKTVLKTTGFWAYNSNEPMTHFLDLLNYAGIISYNRKLRKISLLISPDKPNVPKNIFVEPERPFSNILWMKRILGECKDYICWFDKHFQMEGLEWLWSAADASKIKSIKILSLDLGKSNLNKEARDYYKRFKKEMANKGIAVSWSVIESKFIKDSHDRWIIGGNKYLRNVPNVNAINSGQRSEMNLSDNFENVFPIFNAYWKNSKEID